MWGSATASATSQLSNLPWLQYGWGRGLDDLDADGQEVFAEAYMSDPTWATQGPALISPPHLAGGKLIIELSSQKEAPKVQLAEKAC